MREDAWRVSGDNSTHDCWNEKTRQTEDNVAQERLHHHQHHRVASLGRSVALCPRLMPLRHRSAGEMPES